MPYYLQFMSFKVDSETKEPYRWRHGPYNESREKMIELALAARDRPVQPLEAGLKLSDVARVWVVEVGDCEEFDDE